MKQILGTMTFAGQVGTDETRRILERFFASGERELDTAYSYCEGRTESLLGELLPSFEQDGVYIASKVNPWNDEGLQPQQVRQQFDCILERLGRDSIDLLYLHSPDLETPVEETLQACFELYREGRYRHFGLSNYAAWQVAEVVETCRREGWMEPLVYQGMYNALTRDVERELFPCLRNYGIRFYAYNPLAGGFLTGKHRSIDAAPDSGRFAPDRGYRGRYWRRDYFAVLDELRAACSDAGLEPVEVAMSWLVNHSMLDAGLGDGIILGVSSLEHLQQNMEACSSAPLDDEIIEILERGWNLIRPNCFRYFRP